MKIITFGEIMLRLAPEGFGRFVQADSFMATYGGGEANVAVSLANFGIPVSYITKLPKNEIGQSAINSLRQYGIDTSNIILGGDRMGIYFLEKGANQRPSKVIYDRARSAIATAKSEDFNWNDYFKTATWFHFTGITPALSQSCADICLEACKTAKEHNITISCDLNYRKNLWTKDNANKTMTKLMPYVDVLIANEEDAADIFNIYASETDIDKGKLNHIAYIDVAKNLYEKFNFKYIAITMRESFSASHNNWSACLYTNETAYFSKTYEIKNIVDRVGGGDSFGAGLIYGLSNNMSVQDTLEFATAASALKHSIEGDFNMVNINEVKTLMSGNASGRVQR